MTWAKWGMRIGAVIFVLIGLGALAVATISPLNEWIADNTVEAVNTNPGGISPNHVPTGGVVTPGEVISTAWVLIAVFFPMAVLFWWLGRWFKSLEPSFDALMQTSAQMARTGSAFYPAYTPQGTVVPGSGVITSPAPVSTAPPPHVPLGEPVLEPPDPTAGGIIS